MNPYYVLSIPLLLFLLLVLMLCLKRRKCIKRTLALSISEKTSLLNQLTEPFGYMYDSSQDLFISHQDAPQKLFGYHTFYDYAASFFNMVFDYETIYFNYRNRTWLIELWKGQYGVCSGCELGVYYNETIVTPDQYTDTHFDAVTPEDMPLIYLQLSDNRHPGTPLGFTQERHWWLTLFKLPYFAIPSKLQVDIAIRFPDYEMLSSFLKSFESTLPHTPYQIRGLTISFPFYTSKRQYRWTQRIVRRLALSSCHFLCNAFRFLTRPFTSGGDKVIYLYFYLPIFVRFLFHLSKSTQKE